MLPALLCLDQSILPSSIHQLTVSSLSLCPLCCVSFDLGPRQVSRSGTYHYMSTRNNAFSNRSHKGKLIVLPANTTQAAVRHGRLGTAVRQCQ